MLGLDEPHPQRTDVDRLARVVLDDVEGGIEEAVPLRDGLREVIDPGSAARRDPDRERLGRRLAPGEEVAQADEIQVVVGVHVADDHRAQVVRIEHALQAADGALPGVEHQRGRAVLDEEAGRRRRRVRGGRAAPEDRQAQRIRLVAVHPAHPTASGHPAEGRATPAGRRPRRAPPGSGRSLRRGTPSGAPRVSAVGRDDRDRDRGVVRARGSRGPPGRPRPRPRRGPGGPGPADRRRSGSVSSPALDVAGADPRRRRRTASRPGRRSRSPRSPRVQPRVAEPLADRAGPRRVAGRPDVARPGARGRSPRPVSTRSAAVASSVPIAEIRTSTASARA